ncbi:MAG: hypothetical protein AAF235_03815 [Planctomycetota bacterium]
MVMTRKTDAGQGSITRTQRNRRTGVSLAVAAGVAMMAGGCNTPRLGTYNVRLTLDSGLRQSGNTPNLSVDMIALSSEIAGPIEDKPVSDYFRPGDFDRRDFVESGQVKTFTFGPGDTEDKVLEMRDPIWAKAWKNDENLYVLANLPQAGFGAEADRNRRVALPRQTDRWDTKTITIRVTGQRLVVETPQLEGSE